MAASSSSSDRISIHALREEGDCSFCPRLVGHPVFLSTPSARRATSQRGGVGLMLFISIHALREEGDRGSAVQAPNIKVFLSTPSARRATVLRKAVRQWQENFYPRPPRGGRRLPARSVYISSWYFYPRPPRGGRL